MRVLIFFLIMIPFLMFGQDKWSLKLSVNTNEMQIISPLYISAVLKNNLDIEQKYYASGLCNFPCLEVSVDGKSWERGDFYFVDYLHRNANDCNRIYFIPTVKPFDSLTRTQFILLKTDKMFKLDKKIKDGEGKILLRTLAYPDSLSIPIYSNIIEIDINVDKNKEDKRALKWLLTLENPNFIYRFAHEEFSMNDEIFVDYKKNAEYIIKNFPKSKYMPWAKIILAECTIFTMMNNSAMEQSTIANNINQINQLWQEIRLNYHYKTNEARKDSKEKGFGNIFQHDIPFEIYSEKYLLLRANNRLKRGILYCEHKYLEE